MAHLNPNPGAELGLAQDYVYLSNYMYSEALQQPTSRMSTLRDSLIKCT